MFQLICSSTPDSPSRDQEAPHEIRKPQVGALVHPHGLDHTATQSAWLPHPLYLLPAELASTAFPEAG